MQKFMDLPRSRPSKTSVNAEGRLIRSRQLIDESATPVCHVRKLQTTGLSFPADVGLEQNTLRKECAHMDQISVQARYLCSKASQA